MTSTSSHPETTTPGQGLDLALTQWKHFLENTKRVIPLYHIARTTSRLRGSVMVGVSAFDGHVYLRITLGAWRPRTDGQIESKINSK
jgi:hypothetical protein